MTKPSMETLIKHATLLANGTLLAKREIEWRAKVLAQAFLDSQAARPDPNGPEGDSFMEWWESQNTGLGDAYRMTAWNAWRARASTCATRGETNGA